EEELHTLRAIVEYQLVVENHLRDFEPALGDIPTTGGPLAGVRKLLGSFVAQPAGTVGLRHNAGSDLGEHRIAIGMVPVVVRIEDVASRFIRGLLDGFD